jgi:hypothetical protein
MVIPSESSFVSDALRNRAQFLGPQGPTLGNTFYENVNGPVPQTLTAETSPEAARHLPQAVYDPQKYGDAISVTIPLQTAVDMLILTRPMGARLMLVIYNPTVGPLYLSFGSDASVFSIPITSGSAIFFDAVVPQNDVHLFSAIGGNIPVIYINSLPVGTVVGAAAPAPVALGASVSEKLFQANGNQLLGVR